MVRSVPSPQLLVLGSWVGERRLFHLYLFLTASRMALPQDPSTDPKCLHRYWVVKMFVDTLGSDAKSLHPTSIDGTRSEGAVRVAGDPDVCIHTMRPVLPH